MNPKHVTSLELSKALFETGITKDFESEFVWLNLLDLENEWQVYARWAFEDVTKDNGPFEVYPCLLFDELLELMPKLIDAELFLEEDPAVKHFWLCGYRDHEGEVLFTIPPDVFPDTPIAALSSLASYLLREGKFNNNVK